MARSRRRGSLAALIALLGATFSVSAAGGDATVIPPSTVLGDDLIHRPREILHDEASGGQQSDLVALGNLAFESPQIFGDPARKAGISCGTCHIQGDVNQALFIPGLSERPGGLAVVNPLFNPRTDNGLRRHLDIPSLRGIRYMAPYGRDGRIASLREFTRNVIVNEFNGPEPSPRLVDAITAYMEQIDLLPNSRLGPSGQLQEKASPAARRGEVLFNRAFAAMGNQSCAGCHRPAALFADRQEHDVGTGGVFKTPTLLNADFTAPYFHDGRSESFADVVSYFDGYYKLGLKLQEKNDLVAYLDAVGDGIRPFEDANPDTDLDELLAFSRSLERAVAERDLATITLAVGTLAHEMREIQERFPGPSDPIGASQQVLLKPARSAGARLVIGLRRIQTSAEEGKYEESETLLALLRRDINSARLVFAAALAVSLYNPALADLHRALATQLSAR